MQNNLQKLRKQNELSQNDVAKLLGVTRQAISLYEQGKRQLKEKDINTLVKYFNVSRNYLLGAYSKEEIAKIAQETYKKDYFQRSSDILIKVFSTICDDYFISTGVVSVNIKKEWRLIPPEKVESLKFWENILEKLYIPYVAIRWLIEKPSLDASKKDVIDAVKGAMSAYSYSSSKYNERCIFLAKHTFYKKQVKKDQAQEYIDFNREHPIDNKIYY